MPVCAFFLQARLQEINVASAVSPRETASSKEAYKSASWAIGLEVFTFMMYRSLSYHQSTCWPFRTAGTLNGQLLCAAQPQWDLLSESLTDLKRSESHMHSTLEYRVPVAKQIAPICMSTSAPMRRCVRHSSGATVPPAAAVVGSTSRLIWFASNARNAASLQASMQLQLGTQIDLRFAHNAPRPCRCICEASCRRYLQFCFQRANFLRGFNRKRKTNESDRLFVYSKKIGLSICCNNGS
jgi:hypothetical protein